MGKKVNTAKVYVKENATLIINGTKKLVKKGIQVLPENEARILVNGGYADFLETQKGSGKPKDAEGKEGE
jgi:hypothetical protein